MTFFTCSIFCKPTNLPVKQTVFDDKSVVGEDVFTNTNERAEDAERDSLDTRDGKSVASEDEINNAKTRELINSEPVSSNMCCGWG